MTSERTVRVATVEDAGAVGAVQAEVFHAAYGNRVPQEVSDHFRPAAFADVWAQSLDTPPAGAYRLFVACEGEQVVGIAAVGPSQDPDAEPLWGEVSLLGVGSAQRLRGHGSRLVQACVDALREAGAEEAAVWLLADDEGTRAFLLGAGFAPDAAYRDRQVSPDGAVLREVRLRTSLRESG